MSVGVEEEEENHAESHKVHVDEKEDAAVVETPAALHAADRVCGPCDCSQEGQSDQRIGPDVRKVSEKYRDTEAGQDEHKTTRQGPLTRIEDVVFQTSARLQDRPEVKWCHCESGSVDGNAEEYISGGRSLTMPTGTSIAPTVSLVLLYMPMRR